MLRVPLKDTTQVPTYRLGKNLKKKNVGAEQFRGMCFYTVDSFEALLMALFRAVESVELQAPFGMSPKSKRIRCSSALQPASMVPNDGCTM